MFCCPEAPLRFELFHLEAGEGVEGFLELDLESYSVHGVGVGEDEDAVEEDLVHELLDVLRRAGVGGSNITHEVECHLEAPLDLLGVGGGGLFLRGDGGEGFGNAFLFVGEHVEGDGVGVVGFQEFGLLSFEFVLLEFQGALFGRLLFLRCLEALPDHVLHAGPELGSELDVLVVLGDLFLDFGDEDGFHLAGGAAGVSSGAHEVGVADAGFGFAHVDQEPLSAHPAVHGGFQVVRVFPGSFPLSVGKEDVLDFLPGDLVDEGFVFAGEQGALEFDHARVVRIAQHPVDVTLGDGFGCRLRSWPGGETASDEVLGEAFDGPFTGGIEGERLFDEGRPCVVEEDGVEFASFTVDGLVVAVADRGSPVGAAGVGFHGHAFEDFDGEVAGVELVH